jgi:hypothetical protein
VREGERDVSCQIAAVWKHSHNAYDIIWYHMISHHITSDRWYLGLRILALNRKVFLVGGVVGCFIVLRLRNLLGWVVDGGW